jgi:hypothetical protein
MPPSWDVFRAALTKSANPGLLLRWVAALAEMERFRKIDPTRPEALHVALTQRMRAEANRCPVVLLADAGGVGTLPPRDSSILTFHVLRAGAKQELLDYDGLRRVHAKMFCSVLDGLPAGTPADILALAARRFLLGQPVRLGKSGPAALRIAFSAPCIANMAEAESTEELERIGMELRALFDKIELIQNLI